MVIPDLSSNYMIFSEQLMLKQMLSRDNIPHASLCKNIWDNYKTKYTKEEIEEGILSLNEISLYYKHYGVDKARLKKNLEGYKYDNEIEFIYRCIKSTKLINIEDLQQKIKVIQNI